MPGIEVFKEIEVVRPDHSRGLIIVDAQWNISYNGISIGLTSEAGLCLSGLIVNVDRLKNREERIDAIRGCYEEAQDLGLPKILQKGKELEFNDMLLKSTEHRLARRTDNPLSDNLLLIGYSGAKRALLCSNMQTPDKGQDIIEDFFADDERQRIFFLKEFEKIFRVREPKEAYKVVVPATDLAQTRKPAKKEMHIMDKELSKQKESGKKTETNEKSDEETISTRTNSTMSVDDVIPRIKNLMAGLEEGMELDESKILFGSVVSDAVRIKKYSALQALVKAGYLKVIHSKEGNRYISTGKKLSA